MKCRKCGNDIIVVNLSNPNVHYSEPSELCWRCEKTVDCPRDTDGDGDCGRKYCPICGKKSLQ